MKRNRVNPKREKRRRRNAAGDKAHRELYAGMGKRTPKCPKIVGPVEQDRRRRLSKNVVLPQELREIIGDMNHD